MTPAVGCRPALGTSRTWFSLLMAAIHSWRDLLIRSRLIIGLLLAVALVAIPALAAAATVPITGSTSGSATAQAPEAAASCDPQSPTVRADYICDFDLAGTLTLTNFGTGTYTGTARL